MCHFCLDQKSSKFTASLCWLQLANIKLLLESSKVQFQTFLTNMYTPNYLLSVSFHNSSDFLPMTGL